MSHEWQGPLRPGEKPPVENPVNIKKSEKHEEKWDNFENVEQEEKIISNSELGITYRETVRELSSHRQNEFGIKRIKRRELLSYPDSLKSKRRSHIMGQVEGYSMGVENWPIYDYLTDGRFTSFKTVNHQMFADTPKENRENWLEIFKKEGLYFQKYNPKRHLDVSYGPIPWNSGNVDVPVFFFGNKNKTFVNYLETIINNADIIDSVKQRSHFASDDLKFVRDKDSSLYYYAAGVNPRGSEDFKFNPDTASPRGREMIRLLKEKNVNVFTSEGRTLDVFKLLLKGESFYSDIGHTSIPTTDDPIVPELRWCHSEFAIVPTKNNLNVLFFET